MKIIKSDTRNIEISRIRKHPANRPTGINREKVDLIKHSISDSGYRESQPLTVRPVNDDFEIIEGEHRYVACKELGFTEIPCSIENLDDITALLRLITGNFQTENHPLDIGANASAALEVNGLDKAEYARRTGINKQSLSESINAWSVYSFVRKQSESHSDNDSVCQPGLTMVDESKKLYEISKCKQSDWLWFHNLIADNDLSKNTAIAISKLIRDIDGMAKQEITSGILNIEDKKKQFADKTAKGKVCDKDVQSLRKSVEIFESHYVGLPEEHKIFTYDKTEDSIAEETIRPRDMFSDAVQTSKDKTVFLFDSIAKKITDTIRLNTESHAKREMEYWHDEQNREELEKQKEIEQRQMAYVFNLFIECKSIKDIAAITGNSEKSVYDMIEKAKSQIPEIPVGWNLSTGDKSYDSAKPFRFNIWNTPKGDSENSHFGAFPSVFMENLLYYHTKPFDIVFDPFSGGGTTADVCRAMSRRFYCSDRKVIAGRENDIKEHDIKNGLPEDMPEPDFVFLDPPYWKQAENKYSQSPDDLGNMDIETFNSSMQNLFDMLSDRKVKRIACVIQPTQWKSDMKWTDHIFDFSGMLPDYEIEIRYILPYSTQQYNAQMVDRAKSDSKCLCLNRDLIVWKRRNNA
jgi:ParB/RepB/Spo0J family partition protein